MTLFNRSKNKRYHAALLHDTIISCRRQLTDSRITAVDILYQNIRGIFLLYAVVQTVLIIGLKIYDCYKSEKRGEIFKGFECIINRKHEKKK